MSHYPPDAAEGETLGFWQRAFQMQWEKKESFKWISEEQNIGMITARRICISTGRTCASERITLTHLLSAKAFLSSTHFSAERFAKVTWFFTQNFRIVAGLPLINTNASCSPDPDCIRGWNLPWTHQRESATVFNMALWGPMNKQMCLREGLMRKQDLNWTKCN